MNSNAKKFWLIKSEPEVYSISCLKKDRKTLWTGVRNYQARNFMVNEMKLNDEVLFYHSNAKPTGVAGLARVSRLALADHTAWDKKSQSFDPKASPSKPIWFCVEVEYVKTFPQVVELTRLKSEPALKDLLAIQRGQRLSVQPVSEKDFHHIVQMGLKA